MRVVDTIFDRYFKKPPRLEVPQELANNPQFARWVQNQLDLPSSNASFASTYELADKAFDFIGRPRIVAALPPTSSYQPPQKRTNRSRMSDDWFPQNPVIVTEAPEIYEQRGLPPTSSYQPPQRRTNRSRMSDDWFPQNPVIVTEATRIYDSPTNRVERVVEEINTPQGSYTQTVDVTPQQATVVREIRDATGEVERGVTEVVTPAAASQQETFPRNTTSQARRNSRGDNSYTDAFHYENINRSRIPSKLQSTVKEIDEANMPGYAKLGQRIKNSRRRLLGLGALAGGGLYLGSQLMPETEEEAMLRRQQESIEADRRFMMDVARMKHKQNMEILNQRLSAQQMASTLDTYLTSQQYVNQAVANILS